MSEASDAPREAWCAWHLNMLCDEAIKAYHIHGTYSNSKSIGSGNSKGIGGGNGNSNSNSNRIGDSNSNSNSNGNSKSIGSGDGNRNSNSNGNNDRRTNQRGFFINYDRCLALLSILHSPNPSFNSPRT